MTHFQDAVVNDSNLQKLSIDYAIFSMAFGRDVDFQDSNPQSTYLDRKNGDILWVYDDDEDASFEAGIPAEENRKLREQIKATPEQYLEIPGFSHGGHHKILREFLDSDWTEDKDEWNRVRNAYFGSIGGWKKSLDDENVAYIFYDFRDRRVQQLAERFLLEHGIEPLWK